MRADVRGGRLGEVRQAAARLFAQKGYHGTNMGDIARELGMGAPGLYNHITSKQALLEDICTSAIEQALGLQRKALVEGDHAARLRLQTEAHVRFVVGNRAEALVLEREFIHLDGPARKRIVRLRHRYELGFRAGIEAGMRAGKFHVREPRLASFAIIEMASSVAEWFREPGSWSLDVVAAEYARYALRVVGSSP